MSLILDQTGRNATRIVGVVCDCCHAELRDDIDIHEVVHLRLHAGYGSAWGDGNTVDVDLCDACGHRTSAPYARVVPSAERLPGHVAHGFDSRRVEAALLASKSGRVDPVADGLAPSPRASGGWAWIVYHTLRYFIPARVLLLPLLGALRGFFQAIEREEQALRFRFGRP